MTKASPNEMNELHAMIASELKARIAGGEATTADLSAAIKFLKDNGVECDATTNAGVSSLAKEFPTFDDPDDLADERFIN